MDHSCKSYITVFSRQRNTFSRPRKARFRQMLSAILVLMPVLTLSKCTARLAENQVIVATPSSSPFTMQLLFNSAKKEAGSLLTPNQAPLDLEYSGDDGETWQSSLPLACLGARHEDWLGLSEVHFTEQSLAARASQEEAPRTSDALSRAVQAQMTDSTIEWTLHWSQLSYSVSGAWSMSVGSSEDGPLSLNFELIITEGCLVEPTQVELAPLVWPSTDHSWAMLHGIAAQSAVSYLSDADCQAIVDSVMSEFRVVSEDREILNRVKFRAEKADDGSRRVTVTSFDLPGTLAPRETNSSNVQILARHGNHYIALLEAELEIKLCRDIVRPVLGSIAASEPVSVRTVFEVLEETAQVTSLTSKLMSFSFAKVGTQTANFVSKAAENCISALRSGLLELRCQAEPEHLSTARGPAFKISESAFFSVGEHNLLSSTDRCHIENVPSVLSTSNTTSQEMPQLDDSQRDQAAIKRSLTVDETQCRLVLVTDDPSSIIFGSQTETHYLVSGTTLRNIVLKINALFVTSTQCAPGTTVDFRFYNPTGADDKAAVGTINDIKMEYDQSSGKVKISTVSECNQGIWTRVIEIYLANRTPTPTYNPHEVWFSFVRKCNGDSADPAREDIEFQYTMQVNVYKRDNIFEFDETESFQVNGSSNRANHYYYLFGKAVTIKTPALKEGNFFRNKSPGNYKIIVLKDNLMLYEVVIPNEYSCVSHGLNSNSVQKCLEYSEKPDDGRSRVYASESSGEINSETGAAEFEFKLEPASRDDIGFYRVIFWSGEKANWQHHWMIEVRDSCTVQKGKFYLNTLVTSLDSPFIMAGSSNYDVTPTSMGLVQSLKFVFTDSANFDTSVEYDLTNDSIATPCTPPVGITHTKDNSGAISFSKGSLLSSEIDCISSGGTPGSVSGIDAYMRAQLKTGKPPAFDSYDCSLPENKICTINGEIKAVNRLYNEIGSSTVLFETPEQVKVYLQFAPYQSNNASWKAGSDNKLVAYPQVIPDVTPKVATETSAEGIYAPLTYYKSSYIPFQASPNCLNFFNVVVETSPATDKIIMVPKVNQDSQNTYEIYFHKDLPVGEYKMRMKASAGDGNPIYLPPSCTMEPFSQSGDDSGCFHLDVKSVQILGNVEFVVTPKSADFAYRQTVTQAMLTPASTPTWTFRYSDFTVIQSRLLKDIHHISQVCDYRCNLPPATLTKDKDLTETRYFVDKVIEARLASTEIGVTTSSQLTTHWQNQEFEIVCEPWTEDRGGKEIQKLVTIQNQQYPGLYARFDLYCVYPICSNLVAMEILGLQPENIVTRVVRVPTHTYQVLDPAETVVLPFLKQYCSKHTPEFRFLYSDLHKPGEQPVPMGDAELLAYGITYSTEGVTMQATNITWHNFNFEIGFYSGVAEEMAYWNIVHFKVIYRNPPCELTQSQVDEVEKPLLNVTAIWGAADATLSLKSALAQGRTTMQAGVVQFCGALSYHFVSGGAALPFLGIDFEGESLTLSADKQYRAGTYDTAFIQFKYELGQGVHLDLPILAVIERCVLKSVKFKTPAISVAYVLGEDDLDVRLPAYQVDPDCGAKPAVASFAFTAKGKLPADLTIGQIIEFDMETEALRVKKSFNLGLLGESVSASLLLVTDSGQQPQLEITLKYDTRGPKFEERSQSPPPITCSEQDLDWEFELPDAVAADQQEITFRLIQDQLVGSIFELDLDSATVLLSPASAEQFSSGLCPNLRQVEFSVEIISDILGTARKKYVVQLDPGDEAMVGLFDPNFKFTQRLSQLGLQEEEKLVEPSLHVSSITPAGLLSVGFSHPFLAVDDLSRLKAIVPGTNKPGLEVKIAAVQDQYADQVAFTWEPLRFTSTELVIAITFEKPFDVSSLEQRNEVELVVWDTSLFVRESDRQPLPLNASASRKVPKQLDEDLAGKVKLVADFVANSGQGAVFIFAVLSFFLNYGMNNVLGQVRSLQLITHLMMMQLNYPASSQMFFSTIFEYVTFDMVPTDEIYGETFEFDSEPYSEQADGVGYGSRYVIENTGSCLIYMIVIALQLATYSFVLKCTQKASCKKCHKFSKTKQGDFFWAGAIDFLSELYLNIAFSIGINLSLREWSNASVNFNNVFAIFLALSMVLGPLTMVIQLTRQLGKVKAKAESKAKSGSGVSGGNGQQVEGAMQASVQTFEGGEKEDQLLSISSFSSYETPRRQLAQLQLQRQQQQQNTQPQQPIPQPSIQQMSYQQENTEQVNNYEQQSEQRMSYRIGSLQLIRIQIDSVQDRSQYSLRDLVNPESRLAIDKASPVGQEGAFELPREGALEINSSNGALSVLAQSVNEPQVEVDKTIQEPIGTNQDVSQENLCGHEQSTIAEQSKPDKSASAGKQKEKESEESSEEVPESAPTQEDIQFTRITRCCGGYTEQQRFVLLNTFKGQLKLIHKKEKKDADVKEKFGGLVGSLANRQRLSKPMLICFMLWSFSRRTLQAVIILALYTYPVGQVLLSIGLTLLNLIILVMLRPYADWGEQRVEVNNEVATLLTLYCLMLFIQDYIQDNEVMQMLGLATIAISGLNFLINTLPILGQVKDSCCRCCKKKQRECTLRRMRQRMLDRLRARNDSQRAYASSLNQRFDLVRENAGKFTDFERQFLKGTLNDIEMAVKIQVCLNQERRLDTDFDPENPADVVLQGIEPKEEESGAQQAQAAISIAAESPRKKTKGKRKRKAAKKSKKLRKKPQSTMKTKPHEGIMGFDLFDAKSDDIQGAQKPAQDHIHLQAAPRGASQVTEPEYHDLDISDSLSLQQLIDTKTVMTPLRSSRVQAQNNFVALRTRDSIAKIPLLSDGLQEHDQVLLLKLEPFTKKSLQVQMKKYYARKGGGLDSQIFVIDQSVNMWIDTVVCSRKELLKDISGRVEGLQVDNRDVSKLSYARRREHEDLYQLHSRCFELNAQLKELGEIRAMTVVTRQNLRKPTYRDQLLQQLAETMGLPEPPVPPLLIDN